MNTNRPKHGSALRYYHKPLLPEWAQYVLAFTANFAISYAVGRIIRNRLMS